MGADLARGTGQGAGDATPTGAWAFTPVDVTDEASVVDLVRGCGRAFAAASTALSTPPGWPVAGRSTWSTPRSGTAWSA